jgi:broad specificity phosphatase PhoE
MRLLLSRHGFSKGNEDVAEYIRVGDANVELTEIGWNQAHHAGLFLRNFFQNTSPPSDRLTIWTSSLLRTQQTTSGIVKGLGDYLETREYRLHEDPRLVEQSYGLLGHLASIDGHKVTQKMVKQFLDLSESFHKQQPFTARVPFGESPQDAYMRVDSFFESLRRDEKLQHLDHLIISHGATIKAFFMRWFHLPMNAWKDLKTPHNCDVFCIERVTPEERAIENHHWKVRKIYDGEDKQPCSINPIEHIQRLSLSSLPSFPPHLTRDI